MHQEKKAGKEGEIEVISQFSDRERKQKVIRLEEAEIAYS